MTRTLDTSKPAASLAALNRHLHRLGMPAEIALVRETGGGGYYHFIGGKLDTADDVGYWYTSSVYTYSHSQMTIAQWWRAYSDLATAGAERFERLQESFGAPFARDLKRFVVTHPPKEG